MNYILHYDISAVIVFILTLIIFYSNRKVKNTKYKIFETLIWVSLVTTLFDIISVFLGGNPNVSNIRILSSIMYYLLHSLTPVIFAIYSIALTERLNMFIEKYKCLLLPFILEVCLIVTTPISKYIFYIDDNGLYHRGDFQPIIYLISIFYLIFSIVQVMYKSKVLSKDIIWTVYMCVAICLALVIVQSFNRFYLLECFASSICVLLILQTLQKNDQIIDNVTQMLVKTEFNSMCLINNGNKTNIRVLFIKISELDIISKTFGLKYTNTVVKQVADYLYNFSSVGNAYYLSDGCFALVFHNETFEQIKDISNKIHLRMRNSWDFNNLSTFLKVYTCIVSVPDDIENAEQLINYADYMQNLKFYSKTVISPNEVTVLNQHRIKAVENAINKAIKNDSFNVYYQPIYSIKEKRIVSAEALIRLNDSELGFIPPDEFIPISEKNGTIVAVGECVLRKVCKFISENNLESFGIEYIEVNVSLIQCMQSNIDKTIISILNEYDVAPEKICLEVTETATVSSTPIIKSNMEKLCNHSIHFALDDYGTGMSNLQQMVQLPFKLIKFDKTMIWSYFESENVKIAIESSIAMMKKLNLKVVAEGIENIEHVQELEKMHCDYLQGYYFSKPIPSNEFIIYLMKQNNQV